MKFSCVPMEANASWLLNSIYLRHEAVAQIIQPISSSMHGVFERVTATWLPPIQHNLCDFPPIMTVATTSTAWLGFRPAGNAVSGWPKSSRRGNPLARRSKNSNLLLSCEGTTNKIPATDTDCIKVYFLRHNAWLGVSGGVCGPWAL